MADLCSSREGRVAYLKFSDIRQLHLELTNRCNAACPMCSRNVLGGPENPHLTPAEIRLDDLKRWVPHNFWSQLELIMMCGNFGDPVMARDVAQICFSLKEWGAQALWIHTNGSLRDPAWWKGLAQAFQGPGDRVAFSLDGLEHSNAIYRRGTSWARIMDNAQAFIDGGGQARWDYLVFEHNEQDLPKAQDLAKEMGFVEFRIRKTSRFTYLNDEHRGFPVLKTSTSISGKKAVELVKQKQLIPSDLDSPLRPPQQEKLKNPLLTEKKQSIARRYGDFSSYLRQTPIRCLYKNKFKRYYISADGRLWPCCYIANDQYSWSPKGEFRQQLESQVFMKYGQDFNCLQHRSFSELIQHPWFQADLEQSWELDSGTPRLFRCARTCGTEFEPILSQTTSHLLKEGARIL